jgi:hypothetical protein
MYNNNKIIMCIVLVLVLIDFFVLYFLFMGNCYKYIWAYVVLRYFLCYFYFQRTVLFINYSNSDRHMIYISINYFLFKISLDYNINIYVDILTRQIMSIFFTTYLLTYTELIFEGF